MVMPPEDVEPSELWKILCASEQPSEVVDFPRKNRAGKFVAKVRISCLSIADHDTARLKAHQWMKDQGIPIEEFNTDGMVKTMGDATARHLLALACKRVEPFPDCDPHKPTKYPLAFMNPENLRTLSSDELTSLFTMWQMVQNKFGPNEGNIETEAELSAWVKRLVEGASANPLALLSWHQLVGLVMSLAERAYCTSAALDSHFSTLPDTLKSDLAKLNIGTSYFGKRLASTILPGLATTSSELEEALDEAEMRQDLDDKYEHDPHPLHVADVGEPITVERAAEIAKRLHDRDD